MADLASPGFTAPLVGQTWSTMRQSSNLFGRPEQDVKDAAAAGIKTSQA
jgi:hypothetical protein